MFSAKFGSMAAARPVASAVLMLLSMLFGRFLARLISHRRYFRKLRAQGLPMPPHNFIFGHLLVLAQATKPYPRDAGFMYLPTFVRKAYPELTQDFYLDLWPIAPSMLIVGSPEAIHQVSNKHVLPKPGLLESFLRPLTEGLDIVSLNGNPWKKWRAIFNPGFSPAHISSLTPIVVKEVQVFCDLLDQHVSHQDIFTLKTISDNLVFDIIGRVVLDINFGCQRSFNQVVHSLRTQIKWLTSDSGLASIGWYNPWRLFINWYHGQIVNQHLSQILDKRIQTWRDDSSDLKNSRTIVDLAMKAYAESESRSANALSDPFFRRVCLAQVKIFLFAGHDTTSTAICFTLWLLSQNSDALARLRDEHNLVLGPDPSKASSAITQSPHIMSQLPYTTAVIKESLRIFPPSTGTRAGQNGVNIIDAQGRIFPTTEDLIVWGNQQTTHRDPAYWPQPESFIPDRWLVGPEDPLYPIKGVWRPFEQGPRNCIGQELVMLELKIILVLVSRTYAFKPAYSEVDAKTGRKQTTVFGYEPYHDQYMHPRDNMPIRVERTKSS